MYHAVLGMAAYLRSRRDAVLFFCVVHNSGDGNGGQV